MARSIYMYFQWLGVRGKTIISPKLFNLFINDLLLHVPAKHLYLYETCLLNICICMNLCWSLVSGVCVSCPEQLKSLAGSHFVVAHMAPDSGWLLQRTLQVSMILVSFNYTLSCVYLLVWYDFLCIIISMYYIISSFWGFNKYYYIYILRGLNIFYS